MVCRDDRARHTSAAATPISSWGNAGCRLSGCRRLLRTCCWAIGFAMFGLQACIKVGLCHLRCNLLEMRMPTILTLTVVHAHALTILTDPQVMEAATFFFGHVLYRGTRVFVGFLAARAVRLSAAVLPITLALAFAAILALALTFVALSVSFPGTGTG